MHDIELAPSYVSVAVTRTNNADSIITADIIVRSSVYLLSAYRNFILIALIITPASPLPPSLRTRIHDGQHATNKIARVKSGYRGNGRENVY